MYTYTYTYARIDAYIRVHPSARVSYNARESVSSYILLGIVLLLQFNVSFSNGSCFSFVPSLQSGRCQVQHYAN